MSQSADPVIGSVDYQPSASGPFLWQAFDPGAIDADLAQIATAGFRAVRVGLAWDSFMPDGRGVDRRRLAEFDTLLRSATRRSLQVIPVLFVQSHGDCVLLPGRTVKRDAARPGVRVLSEGRVETGGPRDLWTDPLMLELADRWLRSLVGAFASHPAIAAWDLGDDPATTVRPRRIADLAAWTALMSAPLRAQGDRVHLTLGAGDVLRGRGVRLDSVAAHVDRLDIAVRPADVRGLGLGEASGLLFLAGLAQRLMGEATGGLGMAVAMPTQGESELDEPGAGRVTDQLLATLDESGLAGLRATRWRDLGEHLAERPPFDRAPWLLHCGLVDRGGDEKPSLPLWGRAARAELAPGASAPWPPRLDVSEYYAALPDSLRDLAEAWRRERDNQPAILDRSDG